MIDLTPLDVRNKRGDFRKGMLGYDPQEVDVFLELVAERLEALVRENIQLRDRTMTLQEQVEAQSGREKAVQDALVTAQELRKDIREQAQREAEHVLREAEGEARRLLAEAEAEVRSRITGTERRFDHAKGALEDLERRRLRFLQDFRALLQRELDLVRAEEGRTPLEDRSFERDHGAAKAAAPPAAPIAMETSTPRTSDGPSEPAGVADPPAATGDEGVGEPAPEAALDSDEATAAQTAGPGSPARFEDVGNHGAAGDNAAEDDAERGAVHVTDAEGADVAGREVAGGHVMAEDAAHEAVDVADLRPQASVPGTPSTLELELMAGAVGAEKARPYSDVPDLETVLAEAGIDDAQVPREEISPPPVERGPAERVAKDRLAFFDRNEDKKD